MKVFFITVGIAAWLCFVAGWIANIVKFIGMIGGDVSTMFIARAAGIAFPPLGAVLGFI